MDWIRRNVRSVSLVAVLGVALVAGGAIFLFGSGDDDGREGSPDSYYFEARISVEQAEDTSDSDVLDTLRGWWRAPDRWRWDFLAAERPDEATSMLSDGDSFWFYDGETNTYSRQDLDDYYSGLPAELREGPPSLPASVLIGPVPLSDIDAFLSLLETDDVSVEEAGSDEVLGRTTRVVEIARPGGQPSRLWVDESLNFILRFEAIDPIQTVRAEVVALEVEQAIEDGIFSFQAPSTAREVPPPGPGGSVRSSGSLGSGPEGFEIPEGFLGPGYVPEGYTPHGSGGTESAQGMTAFHMEYRQDGEQAGPYLRINQQMRAGGMSESQRQGEPVSVNGAEAFRRDVDGELRLTWAVDELVITVASDTLPFEELLRVAESIS